MAATINGTAISTNGRKERTIPSNATRQKSVIASPPVAKATSNRSTLVKILKYTQLDMPIILDWEQVGVEGARTEVMDARTLTDMQLHFCKIMTEKGYQPMVYFNWYQSSRLLYLNELEEYPFWLALYQDRMTYPYRVEMWQYTDKGRVPGIQGDVDINVYMP